MEEVVVVVEEDMVVVEVDIMVVEVEEERETNKQTEVVERNVL